MAQNLILHLTNFNNDLKLTYKKLNINDVNDKVADFFDLLGFLQKKKDFEAKFGTNNDNKPFNYRFPLILTTSGMVYDRCQMVSPKDMCHLTSDINERREIAKLASKIDAKFHNYYLNFYRHNCLYYDENN
jgi:hypothetical protein